jgi:hypothetical protein
MQWLQHPKQNNVGNINNVRRETSRHIGNENKEHLKAKIGGFGTNSKIKICQRLVEGHQLL